MLLLTTRMAIPYIACGIAAVLLIAAAGIAIMLRRKKKRKAEREAMRQDRLVTVRFEPNGGTELPAQTGQSGHAMHLDVPKRAGYLFDGWYRDEELSVRAADYVFPENDATFYAAWLVQKDPPAGAELPQDGIE